MSVSEYGYFTDRIGYERAMCDITFDIYCTTNNLWTTFYFSNCAQWCTQYGKSLLDAHFAITYRPLISFMKTWQEYHVAKIDI